jgi:hypothetical protein
MVGNEEIQPTVFVRSAVVPSEKVPVAIRFTVVPLGSDGFGGVIVIEVRTAGVTATTLEPVTPAWVAVMVALPMLSAVTSPLLVAALLTWAT